MDTIKRRARIAGLWYFVASIFGVVALVIVPNKLIVDGDAGATAERLRTMEMILRVGMTCDLGSQVMFVGVVVALFRLFEHVDRRKAAWVVILGALLSVPVTFVAVLCEVAALYLAKGGPALTTFNSHQLDSLSYLFVRLHGAGIRFASIYWGLWLFPFGTLVVRSGFIPRWLGWLLFAAGVSYLADSATWLLAPQFLDAVGRVTAILRTCELPIIFWLLIWGARGPGMDAEIAPAGI